MKKTVTDNNESDSNKDSKFLTTNQGLIISDNQNTLRAGLRGPQLLEDFIYREKIFHFDHERIPERVVHARGTAAHGFFQVYENLSKYSMAHVFSDPSVKTPVFVRFSTVLGSRGAPDNVREVRGFAVKLYTQDGNWDLVGNNMPVFFIQDGIKFPDLIHAGKPEPHNEMPQSSTAHDNFWDFISFTPESAHMVMWALSDRALPRSYSTMNGFGVHTFRLVNAEGVSTFVKFHWIPVKGVHSTVWDETQKIAGKDPDYLRRDLWESIEKGNYPEYELGLQLLSEEDENKFDYDILDATKIIPEEDVPIKIVGKLTLNRNPDNFFDEVEQVAFCTQNVVPGIDFTNDPLLQGRNFSYLDTQLLRLGGPNFHEIPINRAICPVANHQRDGYHRMTADKGKINYEPNRSRGCPMQALGQKNVRQFVSYPERLSGIKLRDPKPEKFYEHFSQATLFFNSISEFERENLIAAACFELGKVDDEGVKTRMIDMFNHIDSRLAKEVAEGIGLPVPTEAKSKDKGKRSPHLAQVQNKPFPINGRKVAAIIADGFNKDQVTAMKKALSAEGVDLETIAKIAKIKASDGSSFAVDKTFATSASVFYDGLYIPGGKDSSAALQKNGDALHWIAETYKHLKPIIATSEGIDVFKTAPVPGVKHTAADSKEVVKEVGVISAGSGAEIDKATTSFVEELKLHRHWARNRHPNYLQVPC